MIIPVEVLRAAHGYHTVRVGQFREHADLVVSFKLYPNSHLYQQIGGSSVAFTNSSLFPGLARDERKHIQTQATNKNSVVAARCRNHMGMCASCMAAANNSNMASLTLIVMAAANNSNTKIMFDSKMSMYFQMVQYPVNW